MAETDVPTSGALASPVRITGDRSLRLTEARELLIFAAATLAAWAHTVDEIRIGEVIAVPFAVANAVAVGLWPRLGVRLRATIAILFGLLWGIAVIPYHVVPLAQGATTGQHLSGLSRLLGGAAMVGVGLAIIASARAATPRCENPEAS